MVKIMYIIGDPAPNRPRPVYPSIDCDLPTKMACLLTAGSPINQPLCLLVVTHQLLTINLNNEVSHGLTNY